MNTNRETTSRNVDWSQMLFYFRITDAVFNEQDEHGVDSCCHLLVRLLTRTGHQQMKYMHKQWTYDISFP